jgi:hypothetical protein
MDSMFATLLANQDKKQDVATFPDEESMDFIPFETPHKTSEINKDIPRNATTISDDLSSQNQMDPNLVAFPTRFPKLTRNIQGLPHFTPSEIPINNAIPPEDPPSRILLPSRRIQATILPQPIAVFEDLDTPSTLLPPRSQSAHVPPPIAPMEILGDVFSTPVNYPNIQRSQDQHANIYPFEPEDSLIPDCINFYAVNEAIPAVAQDTSVDLGKTLAMLDTYVQNEYMIVHCAVFYIDYLRLSHLNYTYLRIVFDPGIL